MSKASVAQPLPSTSADEKVLFRAIAGMTGTPSAHAVKTKRTHHDTFPIADLTVDPTRNYRWKNEAGMLADLAALDVVLETGERASSYEILKLSINTLGIEEPIGAVKRGGKTVVIYGFTRALAARACGLKVVPVFLYDASLSDAEEKLLQLRENAPNLKRKVNWAIAYTAIDDMIASMKKSGIPEEVARPTICRTLGMVESTYKNRSFALRHVDKRIADLAREGRMKPAAVYECYSGNDQIPFETSFITAVLDDVRGKHSGEYPEIIDALMLREAMARARKKGVSDFADVVPEKMPNRKRQSPALLRDIAVRLAVRAILEERLSVSSPAAKIDALSRHFEWGHIAGIGLGAGEVPDPPVLEGASNDDDDWTDEGVRKMQAQHDAVSERYVSGMFLNAFLRLAVMTKHKNFDAWKDGSLTVDEKRKRAFSVFSDVVADAAGNLKLQGLGAKVAGAWKRLSPLFATWVKNDSTSAGAKK